MNIYNKYPNYISFEGLKFKKLGNFNVFEPIPVRLKKDNQQIDCFVKIQHSNNMHMVELNDSNNVRIGTSTIEPTENKILSSHGIYNTSKSKSVNGVGSVIRLGHIITMLENNLDKIELYSLPEAIFFHGKFKFEPTIESPSVIAGFMKQDILTKQDDKRFKDIVKIVKKWLAKTPESYSEALKSGNRIINSYIERVNELKLNKDKKYELHPGFEMVLTKDKILENRDYFNKLFEKFEIEYQITV